MGKPVRHDVLDEAWKIISDVPIAVAMYFLWDKFGLSIALPVFIFILIVIAPLLGLERLSLIAITFFGLSIEMAKEGKFAEALIFISVVAISIAIDELLRIKNIGFKNLKLPILPDSPELRGFLFSLTGAILFYGYSIYEYKSGSSSFFGLVGEGVTQLSNSWQSDMSRGLYKGTLSGILLSNSLFIVWLSVLPGAILSGLLFYTTSITDFLFITFFLPIIVFWDGLWIGLILSFVIGIIEIVISAILLTFANNNYQDIFRYINWTLAHVVCASITIIINSEKRSNLMG